MQPDVIQYLHRSYMCIDIYEIFTFFHFVVMVYVTWIATVRLKVLTSQVGCIVFIQFHLETVPVECWCKINVLYVYATAYPWSMCFSQLYFLIWWIQEMHKITKWKFWGFCIGVVEISILVSCDATSLGNGCLTCQDNACHWRWDDCIVVVV